MGTGLNLSTHMGKHDKVFACLAVQTSAQVVACPTQLVEQDIAMFEHSPRIHQQVGCAASLDCMKFQAPDSSWMQLSLRYDCKNPWKDWIVGLKKRREHTLSHVLVNTSLPVMQSPEWIS